MNKNNNEVIVYWGIWSSLDRQTRMNLMWEPPKSLMSVSDIGHDGVIESMNYRRCVGATNFLKQTYTFINPLDTEVKIEGEFGNPQIIATQDVWNIRPAPLKNRYAIDYDYRWLFFSEESIVMKQTPPYMHNTSERPTATVATGAFDISKWFRPVNATFILWENENTLKLKNGDPLFYLEFQTEKKIILKHFEVTSEIMNLSVQLTDHKNFFPFEPLSKLYNRFTSGHRDKRILKLIKDNLLE